MLKISKGVVVILEITIVEFIFRVSSGGNGILETTMESIKRYVFDAESLTYDLQVQESKENYTLRIA